MAVIAISRQVAALGDEIAEDAAKLLGYKFFNRKLIEQRIIELGFSADKLKKYDERKPGFFASLAKDRDEYLDYLQTAVLEAASEGNCILIGRGSFVILEGVPNLVSVRCIAPYEMRKERLKNEFKWDEKKAQQRILESDTNRQGFHKSFFNIENEEPSHYHLIINTGLLDVHASAKAIAGACNELMSPEIEKAGQKKIEQLLLGQRIVNWLAFDYRVNINFLRASVDDKTITLQGVADSAAIVDKAVTLTSEKYTDKKVISCISIVQDFKAYP